MSDTIIEHIALFKVKNDADPSQIAAMINSLNNLASLDMILHLTAGPIHRDRSTSLNFTHFLHSRYRTKADLAHYSTYPAHLEIVRAQILPICDLDDIMAVDWVAHNPTGPVGPQPRSVMRAQLVRLKEGLGERERKEVFGVIGGIKEKVKGVGEISFGENFSPARAKGFSIASIGIFKGIDELDSIEEDTEICKEKDKVRDYIDSLISVDYVIPLPQSVPLES